jgi:hypothetical protein
MFCKSNGHKIYSSSPKLGKWYYIIDIFLKENSYKLLSKFVHFNLKMFPDDPFPIHYSKTTDHITVEFYFYKEKYFGFKQDVARYVVLRIPPLIHL